MNSSAPKRIIYAFPHAGASASVYRAWLGRFKGDSNLVFKPIEIPGRDVLSREKAIDNLPLLVDRICADIHADFALHQQAGTTEWVTFGHSFGGVLSFIVSAALAENYAMRPLFSVISGSIAPSVQADDDRHLWTDDQIISKMRADNGTPESILNEPAFARRLVTSLRTDYILRHQFLEFVDKKVSQPLDVISADQDENVTEEMQAAWRNHTLATTQLHPIEGGHFAIYNYFDLVKALFSQVPETQALVAESF
ncbi:thioesterase [Serratia fonticola]|uniref:thioesterase II family protein n=1 Tax=Serratia TaxID=613 RepID=UPI0015C648FA|nr:MULTISPECIES: thioesterase [Serratia]MBC3378413.1 thioesterase [Serratia fonticola]NYA37613.1 thioesterase [Serratia fonticola]UAN65074.1 thioesterase [Serratia sp. JSRIV006]